VMEFAAKDMMDSGNDASGEARIFRLNRLFRVLRILRLFRLLKFFKILLAKFRHENISFQLAEHMKSITILRAFICAHVQSQIELAMYFGEGGKCATVEQMRCILESQTEVYRALVVVAKEADDVDSQALVATKLLRENIRATGKLTDVVLEAHHRGVISGREADTITHTLNDHIRKFTTEMSKTCNGRVSTHQAMKSAPATDGAPDHSPAWGDSGAKDPTPVQIVPPAANGSEVQSAPFFAVNGHQSSSCQPGSAILGTA